MSSTPPHLRDGNWQSDPPAEEGDWLWIEQWGCGCCLIRSGIAGVHEWDGSDLAPEWEKAYRYETEDGRKWLVGWGSMEPNYEDGRAVIHWWQKIELPRYPDDLVDDAGP